MTSNIPNELMQTSVWNAKMETMNIRNNYDA